MGMGASLYAALEVVEGGGKVGGEGGGEMGGLVFVIPPTAWETRGKQHGK